MIIIPAIDIKAGKVVRLEQGDMDKDTFYSSDPAAVAKRWADMGAERIHIVDLDGAYKARPVNDEAIISIRKSLPEVCLEAGGGVRNIETVDRYMALGINKIILGTAARKNPELVMKACELYKGNIIVGIDARRGKAAVEGWVEDTEIDAVELAKRFKDVGIKEIIYTDIESDGMMTGLNIESLKIFVNTLDVKKMNLKVITAGGLSCLDDIKKILPLEDAGVKGVITGRAIYEGRLDLKEAIDLCRS